MLSLHTAPKMLGLLYEQHRNYTAELGRTHQKLSKLYKKISKVERVLAERQERQLTRDQRKKWQYSRVLTKGTIHDMELQQANLHDALRQCSDLIASMEYNAYNSPMMIPWSTQFAPSPCTYSPLIPFSPIFTPYAAHRPTSRNRPQSWDLSGLPESSSSPNGSHSADSGYYEPQTPCLGIIADGEPVNNEQHLHAQEMMTAFAFNFESQCATEDSNNSEKSSSEQDTEPELPDVASPLTTTSLGASGSLSKGLHKRCVSANATQLNLSDLAPPSTKRGVSVGPGPDRKSDVSGNGLGGGPVEEK